MLDISVPWWELVVRAVVVYVALITLLRVSGKRQIGQLAPFDFVLLLVLSNAVQNSMNAGDNSLVGGLLSAGTLVGLNWIAGFVTSRNRRMERLVDGEPQVLIHHGRVVRGVLRRAQLTEHELAQELREAGYGSPEEVETAILEINGRVSFMRRSSNAEQIPKR